MAKAPCRKILTFALLFLSGALLPLVLLFTGSKLVGVPPLTEAEQHSLLNSQQTGFENVREYCQLKRRSPRHPKEIVVLGGSAVEGAFAAAGMDFPNQLEQRLEKRNPGQWTVHNLGKSGKTSFWMRECAKAVAEEKGELIWIAYEGHNDFANLRSSGVARSLFFLRHPQITNLLSALLATGGSGWLRPLLPSSPAARGIASFHHDLRTILISAESNYRAMAEAARQSHSRLVLATVISNLALPPASPALPDYPDVLGSAAKFAEAEAAFARGAKSQALQLYKEARDLDPRFWRAPSAFNEMLRRLAREFAGHVSLLDLEHSFEQEFQQEKLGCRFFGPEGRCDLVHPNEFTHGWIARQIEQFLPTIELAPI